MRILLLSLAVATTTASTIAPDCSSSQQSAIATANRACAAMAQAAAVAAESGPESVFESFFKDSAPSIRNRVSSNYRKVADECSSTSSESCMITSYCTNQRNYCGGNLLAYTEWKEQGSLRTGATYYCPRYFELEANSTSCGEQSQGSNTLHEATHAVFKTTDVAYGLENVMSLDSSQALVNADTYTFYAIAIDLDCVDGSSGGSSGGSTYDGDDSGGSGYNEGSTAGNTYEGSNSGEGSYEGDNTRGDRSGDTTYDSGTSTGYTPGKSSSAGDRAPGDTSSENSASTNPWSGSYGWRSYGQVESSKSFKMWWA